MIIADEGDLMDVTELVRATDELAGYLSEVTAGDLGTPVPDDGVAIGDLLVRSIERNLRIATLLTGDPGSAPLNRTELLTPRDPFGTGYEHAYRHSVSDALAAFASLPAGTAAGAEYTELVRATAADTRRLALALALD